LSFLCKRECRTKAVHLLPHKGIGRDPAASVPHEIAKTGSVADTIDRKRHKHVSPHNVRVRLRESGPERLVQLCGAFPVLTSDRIQPGTAQCLLSVNTPLLFRSADRTCSAHRVVKLTRKTRRIALPPSGEVVSGVGDNQVPDLNSVVAECGGDCLTEPLSRLVSVPRHHDEGVPQRFRQLASERLTRHRRTTNSHSVIPCSDRGERVPRPFRDDHDTIGSTAAQESVPLPHLPRGIAQAHPPGLALPSQVPADRKSVV